MSDQTAADDIYRLDCKIRPYEWGSRSFIAELQGRAPTVSPEAELWIGAYGPSQSSVMVGAGSVALSDLIELNPERAIGVDTIRRFGPSLPFLMKVLAAEQPLSLQVHPSRAWAAKRFPEEQAEGIAKDSPVRLYQDSNHKPELLCALTTFQALCGFAPIAESIAMLNKLGGECGDMLRGRLELVAESHGTVKELVEAILRRTLDVGPVISRCREVLTRPEGLHPDLFRKFEWCVALADMYPGDPAAAISLLMNFVTLNRGDSLQLPAGVMHAYLHGAGIEVMAASDNVLRAGLTSKTIAVEELLQVVNFQSSPNPAISAPALEHLHTYESPSREFKLVAIRRLSKPLTLQLIGPGLVICTSGPMSLQSNSTKIGLQTGEAAFVLASAAEVVIEGAGELFLATTGEADVPL
jgi:mannose-6-phosphate isomerase